MLVYSTSFWQRAAEGRSGGAGRRQLRLQGLGVLGGSKGPHIGLLLRAVPYEDGWGRVWYVCPTLPPRDSECLEGVTGWEGNWVKQRGFKKGGGGWGRKERQLLYEGSEVDEDQLTNWLTEVFVGKPGDLQCDRRTEACASMCARPECVCVGWEGPTSPVDRADCYMPPASAHTGHLHDNTHKTKSINVHTHESKGLHTLCLTTDYFYFTVSWWFPASSS